MFVILGRAEHFDGLFCFGFASLLVRSWKRVSGRFAADRFPPFFLTPSSSWWRLFFGSFETSNNPWVDFCLWPAAAHVAYAR